ncbi:DUF6602 domain-containing protein [Rufibacter latericius]|uniref:DUF6602 domain-containing protein n=1 Tax=Rufibacter latericius TaxID=2487040 RepID=A0A3M9MAQ1_9BACT|nr:DUF6602 domain-containing protein [Rufibacter latericius]RNI22649.1 hypothetical protein EFB08_21380 [Rufibacter latericius]
MINSVADLLNAFKEKELEALTKYEVVKHPGIIGDMYEGLTKEILDKSIFKDLGLKVCAGKIKNSKNEYSDEIDCMLVIGAGEQIPYTDKYIYDSSRVVAVIQVKKNLYSSDIESSFSNLRSVVKVTEERDGEEYHGRLLHSAFRLICQTELPTRSELKRLPFEEQMIYHILLKEAFYPARIVWGYNGFKSEYSLRESLLDFIGKNISTPEKKIRGFDPIGFPNLIICGTSSIVKTNGIPFAYPVMEHNWWPLLATSNENPVFFFLEIIWTRLHFMFKISAEIFGDDLNAEELHGFLLARAKKTDLLAGWEYLALPYTKEELEQKLVHKDWQPVFLDECQYVVINALCEVEAISYVDDKDLNQLILSCGYTLNTFVQSLKDTGLVHIKDGYFKLITERCVCGLSPDGRYFAADNKTGRVDRWLELELAKNHSTGSL